MSEGLLPDSAKARLATWLLPASAIVLLICGAVLMVAQWGIPSQLRSEIEVSNQISRVMHLDEILTMSARMAAASRDHGYVTRYNAHVDELDRLIKGLVGRMHSDEAKQAVAGTDLANQRLVEMETKSFELDAQGRHHEAYELLSSTAYEADKQVYAHGMASAFNELQRELAARSTAWIQATLIAGVLLILSFICLVTAWSVVYRKKVQHERDIAKLQAHRITMEAVMDTFLNALNGLQLFRNIAEEKQALSVDEIEEFDALIQRCAERIRAMSRVERIENGLGMVHSQLR